MATKADVIADPESCLNKAFPDEPIFVITASDALAPEAIRYWASLLMMRSNTERSQKKAIQALADVGDFERYAAQHGSHIPGTDYEKRAAREMTEEEKTAYWNSRL